MPFFREKPRDVALSEGEPLELKCLVASEPRSAIHWLKNDLIFMDDSRLRVSTLDSGSSTLMLDPAMPSDAGLYKGRMALYTHIYLTYAWSTLTLTEDQLHAVNLTFSCSCCT